jgi:hypothetical protein
VPCYHNAQALPSLLLLLPPLLLLLQAEAIAASGFVKLLQTTWHAVLEKLGSKSSQQALRQQVRLLMCLCILYDSMACPVQLHARYHAHAM